MAVALPFIGLASTAIGIGTKALGGVAGIIGGNQQYEYQKQIIKNNIRTAHFNALMAQQTGEAKSTAQGLKGRAAYGAITADQAASGVDINTGSSVDVRSSAARLAQLDSMTIKSDAARDVYAYDQQIRELKAQKYNLRISKPSLFSQIFGIGSSLLGGAASAGQSAVGQVGAIGDAFSGGGSGLDTSLLSSAGAGSAGGLGGLEPGMIGSIAGIF